METEQQAAVSSAESKPYTAAWPILAAAALVAVAVLAAAWLLGPGHAVKFDPASYQAVLLSNGQVYYGKLEGYGTTHPVMHEIYYVQTAVDPQSHEQSNVLLKRGKEWHAPDRMWLNANQIILVEPVGADSKVAALISELKKQK
jgi:hypothetical protein